MSSFMFENRGPYGQPNVPAHNPSPSYYGQAAPTPSNLQFYSSSNDPQYYTSRPSLEGNMASGPASAGGVGFGGTIQQNPTGWLAAFSSAGFEGEPPLLEELGVNFSHIQAKAMTVLNPFSHIDERIMDDADMAGPLIFCFFFAVFLLLSGRSQFGYIYGIALLGSGSMYLLLNLMSASGIDAYRTASVLGYCLLPMVGIGALSVALRLDAWWGYLLSSISVLWSTYAASGIFVTVLRMSEQRLLVAYPVGLLYGCFALFSVFDGGVRAAAA